MKPAQSYPAADSERVFSQHKCDMKESSADAKAIWWCQMGIDEDTSFPGIRTGAIDTELETQRLVKI